MMEIRLQESVTKHDTPLKFLEDDPISVTRAFISGFDTNLRSLSPFKAATGGLGIYL